jgi:hypothetical protein
VAAEVRIRDVGEIGASGTALSVVKVSIWVIECLVLPSAV